MLKFQQSTTTFIPENKFQTNLPLESIRDYIPTIYTTLNAKEGKKKSALLSYDLTKAYNL